MRKKIKRLFSVLVAVVCMFSISSFANALEPVEEEPENHFILHESVTRSENIPTKKWDFNDGVYEGSFYGLRTGFYTNVSAGRKSPFRAGRKQPISAGQKSPIRAGRV